MHKKSFHCAEVTLLRVAEAAINVSNTPWYQFVM